MVCTFSFSVKRVLQAPPRQSIAERCAQKVMIAQLADLFNKFSLELLSDMSSMAVRRPFAQFKHVVGVRIIVAPHWPSRL